MVGKPENIPFPSIVPFPSTDLTLNRGLAHLVFRWQKIQAFVLHSRTRIYPQTCGDTLRGATNKTPIKKRRPNCATPTRIRGRGKKSGVPVQRTTVPTLYSMLSCRLFDSLVRSPCFNRAYLHIAETFPIRVRGLNLLMDNVLSLTVNWSRGNGEKPGGRCLPMEHRIENGRERKKAAAEENVFLL